MPWYPINTMMKLSFVNEAKSSDLWRWSGTAYNEGVAFASSVARFCIGITFLILQAIILHVFIMERHNIGPERLTETDGERLPVMTVKAAMIYNLAVHEACLDEGNALKLKVGKKGNVCFLCL